MKVFDLNDERFDIALELFSESNRFVFNDVVFYLVKKDKTLNIDVLSNWQLENLSKQIALEEIERGKTTFNYLASHSAKFAQLIENYKLRFSLIYDYGTGAVEVCYLSNNELIWK